IPEYLHMTTPPVSSPPAAADVKKITPQICRTVPDDKPYQVWPSAPPADVPFSRSGVITDLALTGRYANYEHGDTWFPTWAGDGHLYSPWTDGAVGGVRSSSQGKNPVTGQAKIIGDDPLELTVEGLGVEPGHALPYAGR